MEASGGRPPILDPMHAGFVLIAVAVILAVIGMAAWSNATGRAEEKNRQTAMTRAVFADNGRIYYGQDVQPQRALPVGLFVAAGATGLFGMLLVTAAIARGNPNADAKTPPA